MTKKHELPIIKLQILKRKSLTAIVSNSIKGGDNYLFKNFYAVDDTGKEIDILENGKNSCGAFVSWLLLTLELIKHPHTTVEGTEKDMINSGWYEVRDLKLGAVLLWEKYQARDKLIGQYETMHRHMGFYIGDDSAVSNDSKGTGFPHKHHYTYNNTRKIEKIYWNKSLEENL